MISERGRVMTVLTTDGWPMQWRRAQRGFAKLSETYNDTELYDDDIYHFFQDAWHLKDWIKNDPSVPSKVRGQVEKKVKNVRPFRVAADFANGTKHMILNWHRAEDAQFTERKVTIRLGHPGPALQERVLTLADGSQTTAEAVAAEVMREWDLLLRGFGLVT
jgi:hypothetical protein